jgi:hypothetical protein
MITHSISFTLLSGQGEMTICLQIEYLTVPWLAPMSRVYLRNFSILEAASGPSSEPNTHFRDL